jgi:hypothetical protein
MILGEIFNVAKTKQFLLKLTIGAMVLSVALGLIVFSLMGNILVDIIIKISLKLIMIY